MLSEKKQENTTKKRDQIKILQITGKHKSNEIMQEKTYEERLYTINDDDEKICKLIDTFTRYLSMSYNLSVITANDPTQLLKLK